LTAATTPSIDFFRVAEEHHGLGVVEERVVDPAKPEFIERLRRPRLLALSTLRIGIP